MASQAKRYNIIFKEAPHAGKNTVLVAEVDEGAGIWPNPPEGEGPGIWPDPGPLPGVGHPICKPGDPCWGQDLVVGNPICLPGMPCWEPPPDTLPPDPPLTIPATVTQVPPGVTPPDAPSADATVVIIDFGPDAKSSTGRRTAYAWVNPMVMHHKP